MRYSLPVLAGLAAVPSGVLSAGVTNMTMLWPKPHYENTTNYGLLGSIKPSDPRFPCRSVPPPAHVERVPWPIGGARIKLLRTSTLWNRTKDIDTKKVGLWHTEYSFGQFQGLDVEDVENPVFELDYEDWKSGDFEIGGWCTKRTDIVDHVVKDGTMKSRTNPGISVKKSDLEGVNATLGFYIANDLNGNVTSHTQCVYVQFTSDAPKGPCKKASVLPSDREDDVTYIYPDGFGSPDPGPNFAFNATGMIVGLVIAFILIALGVCCCIRSRKKSRAARPPLPPRVWQRDIELQQPKPLTNPDDEQLPAYSGPPPRYNTGIGPAGAGVPAAAGAAPAAAATTTTATSGGAGN